MNSCVQEQIQPRFDRPEWALKYAYIAEAMKGTPKMNMRFQSSGEELDDFQYFMRRLTADMTPDEIICDGIMLKNTIIRHLDKRSGRLSRWVIGAKYRIPNDNHLNYMKQGDYESMAGVIKEKNRNLPDKWFVVDIIRGYMEGTERMHKTYEEWARKLSVSDKTIYRWAGSREPGYKSIKYYLAIWEAEAMQHVMEKLREIGQLC
jgi:hypothetical protein